MWLEVLCCHKLKVIVAYLHEKIYLMHPQSQRQCFEVYVVHADPTVQDLDVLKTDVIIPSVDDNGTLTLNVTAISTLSINTLYQATLFTDMGTEEAGRFQFCKCTVT